MKPILVLIFVISHVAPAGSSAPPRANTLQTFGIHMERGHIAYPLPSNVALGLFNPDPLLDVAYYAGGKVQVFQNSGNGTFEFVGEIQVIGEVEKMEWRKEKMFGGNIFDQFSWGDLHISFKDGREQIFAHEILSPRPLNLSFPPRIPTLDFREAWRSEPQSQPDLRLVIGDVDNDGKTELVYCFTSESSDSNRIVVYECVGDDAFVVDWDTLFSSLVYGPWTISDVDNDGHKELVFTQAGQTGRIVLLECLGPGQYKYYQTNITYSDPPFKVMETDINHNGIKELCLLTSNPSPPSGQDATSIDIAEFGSKSSTTFSFARQTARYGGYAFDMAVGQIDGAGRDEIIPAGGSFGVNESVPIDYLWHNGTTWVVRQIYTGLQSGTTAPMFVNLDADTAKELFIGGVGPIGHGSCYALDYVGDTTWNVMWADSTLVNTPLSVNAGVLAGQFVVAGANTWDHSLLDTFFTQLHVYQPSGVKLGIWQRDTASIQNFQILDIDNDGRTNLVTPVISSLIPDHLADYEYYGITSVVGQSLVGEEPFQLFQNYPNPFNPVTTISFYLQQKGYVELNIYNVLGQRVQSFVNGDLPAGAHNVEWSGTTIEGGDAASGVYFYRLTVRSRQGLLSSQTKKILFFK